MSVRLPACRRLLGRLLLAAALIVAIGLGAKWLGQQAAVPLLLRQAAWLAPVLPAIWYFRLFGRVVRESGEMERQIYLEGAFFAFAAICVVSLGLAMAIRGGMLADVSLRKAGPLLWSAGITFWGVGTALSWRRYL